MSLFTLRRPVMSRTVYLIIFALYVGLLLNLAFYRQVFTLLPVNSLHNWLSFLEHAGGCLQRDEYYHHARLLPQARPPPRY